MGKDDLNARRTVNEAVDATICMDAEKTRLLDADETVVDGAAGAGVARVGTGGAGTNEFGTSAEETIADDSAAMWTYNPDDSWQDSSDAAFVADADATRLAGAYPSQAAAGSPSPTADEYSTRTASGYPARAAGRPSGTAPLPPQPQTQRRSDAQAAPRPVEAPPQYDAGGSEGRYERILDRGSHWSLKLAKVLVVLFVVLFLGSCVATEFRDQAASLWGSISGAAESAAEDESLTATGEGAFSLSGIADAVGSYLSDAKDATAKALGIAGKAVDAGSDLQGVADKAKDAVDSLLDQLQGLGN